MRYFMLILSLFATSIYGQESDSLLVEEEVYTIVHEPAQFPGGIEFYYDYLTMQLRYPKSAQKSGIQGRVFVQFIVEKDGAITNAKVVKGIGGGCDEEALRVIQSMPNWNPGRVEGQPVRQKMMQNVQFIIYNAVKKSKKKRKGQKNN